MLADEASVSPLHAEILKMGNESASSTTSECLITLLHPRQLNMPSERA